MRAVDLIRKKRDGGSLSAAEIRFLVDGIATGAVPDYQWAAFLMAVVWRGMERAETATLVEAMLHSGTVLDLGDIPGPKVDKHSTGGVGDKTSIVLAPIVAACGVTVPMVSGRGLGHTGGTLDKLESIPGFRVDIDLTAYRRIARECGLVLAGQTAEIAPADRVLYALRDATATVESIPLITASILSKKLAEGIDALVLDVKCGDGAFMKREEDARALAASMTSIGRALGKPVQALLTRMDEPLGRTVGNALEVKESIACLRGEGPADLMEVTLELAAEMLVVGGAAADITAARNRCRSAIADGSALDRLRRVIAAQGGEPRVCDDPDGVLPQARAVTPFLADRAGFVTRLAAWPVGQASMLLGAGRETVTSPIDPAAGIVLVRSSGDAVASGDVIAELHHDPARAASVPAALDLLRGACEIGPQPPPRRPLVIDRLS
ncbi:MAG: thymidine phosphorylase [Pirellulales bacterium]|jgi:pyrimidine-nucleoside phosphorylase/thymidine phosphorylase